MPEEIFFIIITAIVFSTVMVASIFKSVFRYLGTRSQAEQTDAGLSANELRMMIQEAVVEAIEPLSERVVDLEERLDADASPRSGRRDLLEGTAGYRTEAPETTPRQRVR